MKKVLMVAGNTGIGKTSVAAVLCRKMGGQMVSADSAKVYKYMDIGTNKHVPPDVKAHMVDVVEPSENYNSARYSQDAHAAIARIVEENDVPICYGGAGMYLNWLINGIGKTPPLPRERIDAVQRELMQDDWQTALNHLQKVDPEYVDQVTENDYYRLAKALILYHETGKPFSYWMRAGFTKAPAYDWRGVFLYPADRRKLFRRLDMRSEKMVQDGLIYEVAHLIERYGLSNLGTASRAVGYRQTIDFLRGEAYTEDTFAHYVQAVQAANRQYVRRQNNWFRNNKSLRNHFVWVAVEDLNTVSSQVVERISELYSLPRDVFVRLGTEQRRPAVLGDSQKQRTYTPRTVIFSDPYVVRDQLKIAERVAAKLGSRLRDAEWAK